MAVILKMYISVIHMFLTLLDVSTPCGWRHGLIAGLLLHMVFEYDNVLNCPQICLLQVKVCVRL